MMLPSLVSHSARRQVVQSAVLTALINGAIAAGQAQQAAPPEPGAEARIPLSYGRFDFFPRIHSGVMYDNNIYIQPRDQTADVIWNISPGLRAATGDYDKKEASYFQVDYAPTFLLFSKESRNNTVDHEAKLDLDWRPSKFLVALHQTVADTSGSVVDVGDRVDRQVYLTTLQVQYEISPKTSVSVEGTQAINHYEDVQSFNEWTAAGWLDYLLTPKVRVGAGVTGGWVNNEQSVNQTYQQALGRVAYSLTAKVDLHASAGVEVRQFEDGRDDRYNGVFTLGGTYKPRERTEITVEAHRRTLSSAVLVDQSYTATGFNGTLRQQFLAKYAASLTAGFDQVDYFATRQGVAAGRSDDYFYFRAGIEMSVTDRLGVGCFYQYRQNVSNTSAFEFDNHQVGLQAAYRF